MNDLTIECHSDGRGRCFAALTDGTMAGGWCRTPEAAFASLAEKARDWLEQQSRRPWKQVVEDGEVERFVLIQRIFSR